MIDFSKTKLNNGLRVVVVEMPGFHSVCSALYIKAGSRFERKSQSGISHFLEHLVFKGTEKYENSRAISQEIEGVGGNLNAFTGEDETFFYNQVPAKYYARGLEVIKELAFNPKLRETDIEREKPVIGEEIKMSKDNPQQYVVWLLIKLMGEGGPLSQLPAGTIKRVNSLKRPDFIKYLSRLYRPTNMVLVVAGAVEKKKILKKIKELFDAGHQKRIKLKEDFSPTQDRPRIKLYFKKTNQAHLCLGTYGYGYDDPKRYGWALLNTILGEGMSSRLFEEIREKRSLCYAIGSHVESLAEIGVQNIYAGLKKSKVDSALKAVLKELDKLRREGVSDKELKKAKELEKGGIDLNLDDVFDINQFFGERELFFEEKLTPGQYKDKIDEIKKEELKAIAEEIYQDNRLNVAIIGPYKKEERFKKILNI